jgi:four helix bundle protein
MGGQRGGKARIVCEGWSGRKGKSEFALAHSLNMQDRMLKLRHHSLIAWQRADDLFVKLHVLTIKQFPAFERFELGSQLRKAAYSVPANIVEGFARRHRRERLHFLNIAEGSLAEVGYCLHVAMRLGYISSDALGELEAELNGVGAPLVGLIRSTRLMTSTIPLLALLGGVVLIGEFLL